MKHAVEFDTALAEKAGIPLRGPGGRSFFARGRDEGVARFRVWTDASYAEAAADVAKRAGEFIGADVVVEVGPPGRH